MKILIPLAVCLFAAAAPAAAQVSYPPRPAQGEFILDEAKLLKAEDAAEIRKVCGEVLAAKRSPIVVVTIKSLSSYGASGWPIQRYAMNLFAEWAVGWSDWNYGILLLVSTGDRKARIELGASWGHVKDPDAQRVMNEEIVPKFKRGDYSSGILAGVRGLKDIAMGEIKESAPPQVYGPAPSSRPPAPDYVPYQRFPRGSGVPDTSSWVGTVVVIIVVLVVVLGIISMVARGGTSSWGGMGGGYNPGCSAFAGGCLGSGLGSWFGGGGYHRGWGYWDDPWDRPWGGGGWFGGGGSGGGSSGGSWGGGDSSSSGGGFSGGGGASGEW